MKMSMFFLLSLLGFSSLSTVSWGMQEPSNEEMSAHRSNSNHTLSISPCTLSSFSFNDLSPSVVTHVADYLGCEDQFHLAQTSRSQLFLWASVGRVPEFEPVVLETEDITRVRLEDTGLLSRMNRTVVIELKDKVTKISPEQFATIQNLGQIQHLHFEAHPYNQEGKIIWIGELFDNNKFSRKFLSLQSFVLKGCSPQMSIVDNSLQSLRSFVVYGQAVSKDPWEGLFPTANIILKRPNMENLLFYRSKLTKADIFYILQGFCTYNGYRSKDVGPRYVEIRENNLDMDGNEFKQEEPWSNAFDFRLKPWVMAEDGNVRFHFQRDHFVPGPTQVRHLNVRLNEQEEVHLPWYEFLTFLSPAYFSVGDLIPVLRTWTAEGRLKALLELLPGSRIEQPEQGTLSFVLPQDLQAPFSSFWHGQEEASSMPDKDKKKPCQGTTLSAQPQEVLEEPIRVAASRHSQEVVTVPIRTLVEVIRVNAQDNPEVQSLLGQLPSFTVRQSMLGWFREVLESFTGESDNEIQEPNNAEILVGSQLMVILRGFVNTL